MMKIRWIAFEFYSNPSCKNGGTFEKVPSIVASIGLPTLPLIVFALRRRCQVCITTGSRDFQQFL